MQPTNIHTPTTSSHIIHLLYIYHSQHAQSIHYHNHFISFLWSIVILSIFSQHYISTPSTMQSLSYAAITPHRTARTQHTTTQQQRHWKKYHPSTLLTQPHPISAVSSHRNPTHLTAIAHANTLLLTLPLPHQHYKPTTIKLHDNITACCLRADGAVVAMGCQGGRIEVKDSKEKFHLRTFDHHKKRINALEYVGNYLYSGGDDCILRQFDVAAGEVVRSYNQAHQDYIRSVRLVEENLLLTGGYDSFVRLHDLRAERSIQMEYGHGAPVEAVEVMANGLSCVAVGGKEVTVWDVRMGQELARAANSRKTVTGVKIANDGARIITVSLDQHMKVYKSDTLELTYQQKLPAPIFCFDVTHNTQHVVLGLQGGSVLVKSRPSGTMVDQEEESDDENQLFRLLRGNERKTFAYNDQHFYRGIYAKAKTYDIKFEASGRAKDSPYDSLLKKFDYKGALLLSIQKNNPMMTVALIDEYVQRGCLGRTLGAMTEEEIEQLLKGVLPLARDSQNASYGLLLLQQLVDQQTDSAVWKKSVHQFISDELSTLDDLVRLDGLLELVQSQYQ